MKKSLSSRERLFLTINHKEPDYIPLCISFFDYIPKYWSNQFQRAEELLALGVDDTLAISPPFRFHPNVKVKKWSETSPDESHSLLVKEYYTPKGTLRTVIKKTQDWPHGDDIPLFSDFIVPRAKKHLISTNINDNDLEKLPYLLWEPNSAQLDDFYKNAKEVKRFADEHGLLIGGNAGTAGDTAFWLCNVEDLLVAAIENPPFVEKLLDIIHQFEMKRIQRILDVGVDMVVHRAYYETTDFWSPSLYRRFFVSLLRKEIELVHQAGAKFGYIMSTGIMPLLQDFLKLGIDILIHVDPVEGKADLKEVKNKIGEHICIRGGVNSCLTIERGTKEEIRQAVFDAVRILGPGGGFILSPVDVIMEEKDKVWPNILTMIEAWKEVRKYPLSL